MTQSSDSDTLVARFIKGTALTGMGKMSKLVFGMVGLMVVARYVPKDDFGAYVILLVAVSFFAQMTNLGMDLSIARFISGDIGYEQKRVLVNSALLFRTVMLVLASPLVLVLAKLLGGLLFGSAVALSLMVYIPAILILQSLGSLVQSGLQGFMRFKAIGLGDLIASLSNLALILWFLLVQKTGVEGVVYARALSYALSLIVMYLMLPIPKRLELDFKQLRNILEFGWPLQLNDILTFLFVRLDTLLVGAYLGPASIAVYEIARRIPDNLNVVYMAFRSVFFPTMSELFIKGELAKAARVLNHSVRLLVAAALFGAFLAVCFGEKAIVLMFSEDYRASGPVFVILMITLAFSYLEATLGFSLVALGDSRKPAVINVVRIGVMVVCNLLLLPAYGIIGAALAGMLGSMFVSVPAAIFLRRWHVYLRLRECIRSAIIFAAHAVPVLLLQPPVGVRVLLVGTYLAANVSLAVVTRADFRVLGSLATMVPGLRSLQARI